MFPVRTVLERLAIYRCEACRVRHFEMSLTANAPQSVGSPYPDFKPSASPSLRLDHAGTVARDGTSETRCYHSGTTFGKCVGHGTA